MSATNVGLAHRDIARSIRFQQHPTLTACWIWTGYVDNGRPQAFFGGTQVTARRSVYRTLRGDLPDGNLKFCCGNDLCVNPAHVKEAKK